MQKVTCDICETQINSNVYQGRSRYQVEDYCQPCKIKINEFNEKQVILARAFKEKLKLKLRTSKKVK